MKLRKSLLFILSLLILIGCAPRYLREQPAPRKNNESVRSSFNIIKEVERNNRDFQFGRLLNKIKFYIGTPYRYGGDTRRGMDCSGFVSRVFKESYKMKLPRSAALQYEASVPISTADLTGGDLVFFKTEGSAKINHVGIYLGSGYFAHASSSRGVVVSDLSEDYYQNCYYAAARILE